MSKFIAENPDIPEEYYGKWIEILNKAGPERDLIPNREERQNATENVREKLPMVSSIDKEPIKPTSPMKEHHEPRNETAKERNTTSNPISQTETEEGSLHTHTSTQAETPENANHPPRAKDFNIPENEEEYHQMIDGMMKCGMKCSEAEANLKTRKTAFNKALREYDRDNKPPATRKAAGRGRKSSF